VAWGGAEAESSKASKASKLSTWKAVAWGGAEAESGRMLAACEMARYHEGSVIAVRDRRCNVWGAARGAFPLPSQYLYCFTSKASKLSC
jgi:hypothetical protein